MKTFTRRDSATALLRKMGIDKSQYSLFITQPTVGTYVVDVEAAETSLKPAKKAEAKPAKKAEAKPAKKAEAKPARRTISSVARELIVAGKSNTEVWAALQLEFGIDDSKKWYPVWYRAECKRKGLVH